MLCQLSKTELKLKKENITLKFNFDSLKEKSKAKFSFIKNMAALMGNSCFLSFEEEKLQKKVFIGKIITFAET